MTHYRKWDIVLVPFPFTDLSSTKKRPALVVSPNQYNAMDDLVIAFITSNLAGNEKFGDYLINSWQQSGLPLPSKLRMKFATVSKDVVLKKIGSIPAEEQVAISNLLRGFFVDVS